MAKKTSKAVPLMGKGLSKQEKQWQAESDARSLSEAKVIMSDPKRLAAAAKEAAKMAKEKIETVRL